MNIIKEIYVSNLNLINCSYNKISDIKTHNKNGIINTNILKCNNNFINNLPLLDNNCEIIDAERNRLSEYNNLPTNLKYLNLSRNYFYINYNIYNNNLIHLNLSHNMIKKIPFIANNIKILILSDNPLTKLPDLHDNLEVLKVSNCKLTELPELPYMKLRLLSCKNNNLLTFPQSLIQCIKLFDLKYEGNNNLVFTESQLIF